MKRIKRIRILGLALLLISSMTTNVLASSGVVENREMKGFYVTNPLLKDNDNELDLIQPLSIIEGEKKNMGGGQLWATWNGGYTFRANYYHRSRIHRCTATNGIPQQTRSAWEQPYVTARTAWLTQTITHNRIFYNLN